jgi:hypothetical protein
MSVFTKDLPLLGLVLAAQDELHLSDKLNGRFHTHNTAFGR